MTVFELIYDVVRQIPYGRVSTYGQIARLIGNPRFSQVVGFAMGAAPEDVPTHRVVKKGGVLSDAFQPLGKETHRMLLAREGVPFAKDGTVDLDACFWAGPATPDAPSGPDTAPGPTA